MRRQAGIFPRKRYLTLAAVLGAAIVPIASVVSSATEPTVSAVCSSECSSGYPKYAWSPAEATVGAGGGVVFANTTPGTPHGIVWTSSAKPTCDSSVPVGAEKSSPEKWSGTCTFSQAGTYTFYCSVHGPTMSGTVTVAAGGTTLTTTTPPTSTETTNTTTPPPPAEESPLAGARSQALKLAKSQHGGSVRGTLDLSPAAAGGRLEVDLLAQPASLASARHRSLVRVGRLVRGSLPAGRIAFSVKLDAQARRALRRRHRLTLTVRIALSSATAKPLTVTQIVVEHSR